MASNLNATTILSSSDLIERYCVFGANIFFSILGIFGNATVLILILKTPQLRKHCKYLQAALAAGDTVLCWGQLTNAVVNLIIANFSLQFIRWRCLLLSTHGALAIMYSAIMTVFIALDRCYAVTNPIKYRMLPKLRLCLYGAGSAFSISSAFALAAYTDVNLYDYPPACIGSNSRSVRMSGMINNFNAAAGISVMIIYSTTLITIDRKTKRLTQNSNNSQYFIKQVEVTASITCVIVASLIIYVIPNLLLIILKLLNVQSQLVSKAPSYIGLGSTIHSGMNCLFYFWKDAKMRDAFVKLLAPCFSTTTKLQVLPIASVTHQN